MHCFWRRETVIIACLLSFRIMLCSITVIRLCAFVFLRRARKNAAAGPPPPSAPTTTVGSQGAL